MYYSRNWQFLSLNMCRYSFKPTNIAVCWHMHTHISTSPPPLSYYHTTKVERPVALLLLPRFCNACSLQYVNFLCKQRMLQMRLRTGSPASSPCLFICTQGEPRNNGTLLPDVMAPETHQNSSSCVWARQTTFDSLCENLAWWAVTQRTSKNRRTKIKMHDE